MGGIRITLILQNTVNASIIHYCKPNPVKHAHIIISQNETGHSALILYTVQIQ